MGSLRVPYFLHHPNRGPGSSALPNSGLTRNAYLTGGWPRESGNILERAEEFGVSDSGFGFRFWVLGFNVAIALKKGMTILFCCWAGTIPDNQFFCLTSLEREKVYLRSIGNNEGVAIIFSGPQYPDFTRFPFTCTTGTTSCTT